MIKKTEVSENTTARAESYAGRAGRVLLILLLLAALIAALAANALWSAEREYASAQNGSGAIVIEATGRRVLYAENKDLKLYPASTTKVLTALVALEKLPLDLPVEIPAEAVGIEGSSIYLKQGDVVTVEELLYGLMLRSGNDAATALAIAVSGSVEAFAALMNAAAVECGATDSNFVNPHGLHDDLHYTTASDLALITAKAFENADFRKIVSSTFVSFGSGEGARHYANKNKLLKLYDGANGVKTGFTKKSGRCLVGAAYREGMQLISVVLNRPDMWNDTMRMLSNCFDSYYMCPIETALPGAGNPVDVEIEFASDGAIFPRAYPVRKDGSEYLNVIKKQN